MALALTVGGIAALAVWWMVRSPAEAPGDSRGSPAAVGGRSVVDAVPPPDTAPPMDPVARPSIDRPWADLPAETIIDSPDCRLVAGRGEASGVAVVLAEIPGPEDAWYAVVDADGVLFGGHLPSIGSPSRVDLGRRQDGSVVMAFGTVDQASMVVLDGQTIYGTERMWDLDVADDGSSFVVIEQPLAAGDVPRLVVRNLDLGLEHHHDLGDLLVKQNADDRDATVRYSANGAEAIVRADATYRSYPVDGGQPREVRVAEESFTLFPSPELSYQVRRVTGETASNALRAKRRTASTRISRVDHRFGVNGEETAALEVWSREFPFEEYGSPFLSLISDDGAWWVLGYEKRGLGLDSSSGKTAVSVPFDETTFAARGKPTGVHYREGRMLLYRDRVAPDASRRVEIFDPNAPNLLGEPDTHRPVDTVPQKRYGGFLGADAAWAAPFPHGGRSKKPCTRPVLSDGRILVATGNRLTYRVASHRDRPGPR